MDVLATDEFEGWLSDLKERDQDDVDFVVHLLVSEGIRLAFPHSSALEGSRYALRELRPRRGRSPMRVVYAFDPNRDAVLLLGGSKTEARFYKRLIARSEELWEEHLEALKEKKT